LFTFSPDSRQALTAGTSAAQYINFASKQSVSSLRLVSTERHALYALFTCAKLNPSFWAFSASGSFCLEDGNTTYVNIALVFVSLPLLRDRSRSESSEH